MKDLAITSRLILIGLTALVLSGCGSREAAIWDDNTNSHKMSPRFQASHEMAISYVSAEHLNKGGSVSVTLSTPSEIGDGQPHLRGHWSIDKAVTPQDEQRRTKQIVSQIRDRFREIEQEPCTSSASRIIEELYNIAETVGADGYRELVALTDLEQFTPGGLTAAQIITADDTTFKELVTKTLRDRPRLAHPPDKIVVFHALSKDGYEHMTPAQVKRLRQFMEEVFHGWGIRECEIIPV